MPWIGIKDARLYHGRVIPDTIQHATSLGIENSAARVLPARTVCLSRTASIGYVTMMGQPMATSQDFVNWVCSEDLDPRFLMSLLIAETESLLYFASGSTHQTIYFPEVKAFYICLPPLGEQRRIAAVLGALDDRIEVNRRMNQTLEAMAQALFRRRFVDFDGRDDLVESEAGPIPEGWEMKPIGEVIKAVGGGTPRTKNPEFWEGGDVHWTTPKDLSSLDVPVLLDTERKITEAGLAKISSGLLPKGTVLMSSRAPVGYLAIAEVPLAVNQGYVAIPPEEGMSNLYVLFWLSANMDRIKARAGGTTFQEISKRNFRPIPMLVPPREVLEQFDAQVRPLYDRIVVNVRHARTLAALRDALLPKLVSGEIRVPEAEAVLETAT